MVQRTRCLDCPSTCSEQQTELREAAGFEINLTICGQMLVDAEGDKLGGDGKESE